MVVRLPSGTTPAELAQVQSLITRGKEGAVRGDPKLTRIRQFLVERGFESPESEAIRKEFLQRQQKIPTLKEETERILQASVFLGTAAEQRSKAEGFARQNIDRARKGIGSRITPSEQAFLVREKQKFLTGQDPSFKVSITQGEAQQQIGILRKKLLSKTITKNERDNIQNKISSLKSRFDIIDISKDIGQLGEIFSPELGGFIRPSEESGQATGLIRPPTPDEKLKIEKAGIAGSLEGVEIALFPALVGKKFLDSQLGAKLTSGKIQEEDRELSIEINDLLKRTAGFGPDAAKASLELLRLIKQTDRDIQEDVRRADKVGKTFERFGSRFDKINKDLEDGKISEKSAIKLQNELLKKFASQGFIIDRKNGSVDISHPVYDRLSGFTGSAWSNILKQARAGDSPIKDQSLIGTLDFLNSAYEAEKIILAFQLVGGAGLKLPAVTGTVGQLKVFNTISALSGGGLVSSFGVLRGVQQFAETGEPLLALTSAAGTVAGFLAPSSLVKINESFKALEGQSVKRVALSKRGRAGGRGRTKQVQVKKPKTKVKKKVKLEITNKQAQEGFAKLPRSRQIQIIEKALRGERLSQLEVNQAKTFMKRSGLTDFQIDDRIAETLRRIQLSNLRQLARGDKALGIDVSPQLKEQIRVLIQGKSQILKVLKQKTISSQVVVLKPLQIQQQKTLQLRIQQTQSQLQKGFLTPLQESILKSQLLSLQKSLRILTTGKTQVSIVTISPQQTSFQRQVLQSKQLEQRLRLRLKTETNQFSKSLIQNQIKQQQQKQKQLQLQESKQLQQQKQTQNQKSLQTTTQQLNQLTVQQSRQKSLQASLTRQLQFSKNKTKQDSLTKQLSALRTLQKQTTKQITQQRQKQKLIQRKITTGKTIKRPTPKPPTPKGFRISKKRKLKKKKKFLITKPKKFQVFVRKRGKDILFKSFKTKKKARMEIRKVLGGTLRASGFIFDKQRGVKVRPKIKNPKVYRVGKNDPFRLVERRNKRITKGTREVPLIQDARKKKQPIKKQSKVFKNKSNFKKIKEKKLK